EKIVGEGLEQCRGFEDSLRESTGIELLNEQGHVVRYLAKRDVRSVTKIVISLDWSMGRSDLFRQNYSPKGFDAHSYEWTMSLADFHSMMWLLQDAIFVINYLRARISMLRCPKIKDPSETICLMSYRKDGLSSLKYIVKKYSKSKFD